MLPFFFVVQYRRLSILVIVATALLAVWSVFRLPLLRFDYHFESFFPANDPELTFFNQFKEKFGNDNDHVLIGVVSENGIFNQEFLSEINRLTDSLQKLPHIESVMSPVNLSFIISGPFGPVPVPYLHPDDPSKYTTDSIRIYEGEGIAGVFFSRDGQAVNLLLQTIPEPSKVKSDSIVIALNRVLSDFDFDEVHVAGKVPAQFTYINRMQQELIIFISLAVLLLIITLGLMFRTLWSVLIPLILVFLSILFLLAIMTLTGKDLDLMMTLMPTMLFVAAMADSIHLLARYGELMHEHDDKLTALKITVKEIGLATFLTSLTTGVGFLSLMTTTVVPVREFGIYIAIGVGIAFVLTVTFMPAVLVLLPPPRKSKAIARSHKWDSGLRNLLRLTLKNRTAIYVASIVVLAISFMGMSRINVNTFLLEDLRKDDPLRKDFEFIESRFGGVRPLEIMIGVKDSGSIWDYENIVAIERVSHFVKVLYGTDFLMSPATVVKIINQSQHGGSAEYYRIPANEKEYNALKRTIRPYRKLSQLKSVATEDESFGRITGRMGDKGSKVIRLLDEQFYLSMDPLTNQEKLSVTITGTARLIDKNISYMSVNMVEGLLVAFLLIALIAGLMFSSVKMVLIALVPNMIPLIMIAGIMGWMGIDLKVSTSVIFTIAFGIAVDDTIHFLSRLRIERHRGHTEPWAIRRAYHITGKAILLTSLVLIAGFFTLNFSSFEGTWLVGLLVSLTLLFAVIADLLLLPLLLTTSRKNRKRYNENLR